MIFVSAPYSHDDKDVVENRVKEVANYCAAQIIEGQTAISPLLFGRTITKYSKFGSDYKTWQKFCEELLYKCDEMHVLTLPGWNQSAGVIDEIRMATTCSIKVVYVLDPEMYS